MKCPKCQHENTDQARFCEACGHRLTYPSRLFHETGLKGIQDQSPERLAGTSLPLSPNLEGEQKQVTVMFCDVAGFTAMVEKLSPEEAYFLVIGFYEILVRAVRTFGGTVHQLTGDGIMALFGAPIALEDGPQRSLRSALSIHREINLFNEKHRAKMPLKMRIGIHTGPVVFGKSRSDLRGEFEAVGDTINLASRMEGLAEPGTTFLTKETFKFTRELFDFEAVGEREVKGKKDPVPVYKLLAAREDVYRHRLGAERMIYSKMVGREKEIETLHSQVIEAIGGNGSIVNIIGEAGIGKSRLVAELKNWDIMSRITLLEGRAISMGKHLSFHPIADLLKQWAGIRGTDTGSFGFTKLKNAVKSINAEEIQDVVPFLATLMGMKLSGQYAERLKGIEGEALEKLILKKVKDFLVNSSELSPMMIIMEDFHWADSSSIDLMEYLFGLVETQQILFLNIIRPGYDETGDRIIETLREKYPDYYCEIVLQPLDEKMSRALINNMLKIKGFQHAFIDQIVERSGGNPFFIEEVIRDFIDQGAIVTRGGAVEVTEKISDVVVPPTINDVLMARIDRLEEETRDLLMIASVIGRSFFYRILSEVVESVDELDERLSHLREIQILRQRKRKGEVEYFFKHALAQEAVYDAILPHRRQILHLRVADSIERIFAENLHEFYGMLAYHYSRAESPKKAEAYLIKAGEEALKSSASNEALYYYQDALALYLTQYDASTDPTKVAMIEKNIALALYNRGQYDEALEYFEKALDYYWGSLPKNSISAGFKFSIGFIHFLISIYLPFLKYRKTPTPKDNESIDLFFKKLKILVVLNPKTFFIQSFYFNRRVTEFDLNKIESGPGILVGASSFFSFTGISFKLSQRILDFVEEKLREDDIRSLIVYDFSHTLHHYLKGNWDEIKDYDSDLMRNCLDMGEVYFVAQHLYWHACPKVHQGNFKVSEELAIQLNDLYTTYLNDFPMLLKYLLTTSLLIESRRLHDALDEVEEGIEFGQKIRQGSILIEMYSRKAHIHILTENIEGAENALNLADNVRAETDTVPWQLHDFFRTQFEIDLFYLEAALEDNSRQDLYRCRIRAKRSARKLLKIAQKVALIRTESYRLMGSYFWMVRRQPHALKWWEKSIKAGETLGAFPELARTYFEVGRRLSEPKSNYSSLKDISAVEYTKRARALFEEQELHWDLNKIDLLTRPS